MDNIDNLVPREGTAEVELTLHLRWKTMAISDKTQYYTGSAVDPMLQKVDFPYYKIQNSRSKLEPSLEALTITPDGLADYVADLTVVIETPMDMHLFPFDNHTLDIRLLPFGESAYQERYYLLSPNAQHSSIVALNEWKMSKPSCQIVSIDNKPAYEYTLQFDRIFGYYLHKIMLPIVIILAMSYGVLWLPNQSAIDRIGLLSSLLLMVVAFQWVIAQDLPSVSYLTIFQATLLLVYFLISSKAIFIILGETLDERNKLKLMYCARWFYPIFFLLGVGAINFFLRL